MLETPFTIETQSGHFALELNASHVTLRATDKLKTQIREETASDPAVNTPGLGGRIARLVTGGLEALAEQEVRYPLEEIESVSYDGNTLRFDYRNRKLVTFESVREDERPVLANFGEGDARAFVEAFDGQKAALEAP